MKNKLIRNWGLKLGSFLFAVILWLIVTNINDPIGTYRVSNVPVQILNANLITDNNQVYEVLDGTDTIGTVTISAKRSIIDSLNASDVVAIADMNDLTSINTINIQLSTNRYNDRLESITGSIDSVRLNIENKRTKTLPLRTNTTGEVREGYMIGEVTTEQNLVEISGPESVVSEVSKAVVTVDVSGFTNNIGTDSPIRLYDENDVEITASSIVKNISKVRVNVAILETKTVPIVWNVSGVPGNGYQATGEITATRENVMIAGRSQLIADIESLVIPESALDITGAVENMEILVDLNQYLPDGVILAEEDFRGRVVATVYVEPTTERRIEIPVGRIALLNVPEGWNLSWPDGVDSYAVVLVGLAADLDTINVNELQASVDMAAYMREEDLEELSEGYYTPELSLTLENTITMKTAVHVRLEAELEE